MTTETAKQRFQRALELLRQQQPLTRELAQAGVEHLMTGQTAEPEAQSFLLGLREKGETVEEVVGCARAMREHAAPFVVPSQELARAVDTCGTGGDEQGT